jgi:peptidoglycan/LPS O-acetylase OafA/YrhL
VEPTPPTGDNSHTSDQLAADARPDARRRRPVGDRLLIVDLLRFVAASSVVGYHVLADNGQTWANEGARALLGDGVVHTFGYGWMGVEFFFIISGFVICMSSWGKSVSQFFVSRVTRLFPAYLAAVLLTAALLTLWPLRGGRPTAINVALNLTMVQQLMGVSNIDNVYWTLLVELKFYLIFTAVIAFGVTYRRVLIFCSAWIVAALFAMNTNSALLSAIVEPRFTGYFVLGITMYLMYRFGPNLLLWGMFGIAFAMDLSSLVGRVADQNAGRPEPINSIKFALPVIVVFILIMLAATFGRFDWLRWRGLVVLGALTYPMYLMHFSVSRVMFSQLSGRIPGAAMLTLVLVVVLLIAYLTYRLVERPASRVLKRRLTASFAGIASADMASRPAHAIRRPGGTNHAVPAPRHSEGSAVSGR